MSRRSGTAAKSRPTQGATIKSTASERKALLRANSGVTRKVPTPAPPEAYPIGKGRKALKGISIYMHPLAKDALDAIAEDQGKSIQELGLEALNLLFRDYGRKPVA